MTDNLTLTEFVPGGKVKAQEINGNFSTLKDAVEAKVDTSDTTITKQGNSFNGANQLVQTNSNGKLPAIDGSLLTGINAGLLPVIGKGTMASNFTLDLNKVNTASITAALTISLPTTGFINGIENKCILDFTTASSAYPIIGSSNYAQGGKDLYINFDNAAAKDYYGVNEVTVKGSPSFAGNKYTASGTTCGIALSSFTSFGSLPWCMQGKFNLTAAAKDYDFIFRSNAIFGFQVCRTANNKIQLLASTGGTTWDVAISGTKTDWNNTTNYYIRLRFTGTQYLVDWSTDYNPTTMTGTWTNDITVNNSNPLYAALGGVSFGSDYTGAGALTGTMDDLQITAGSSTCINRDINPIKWSDKNGGKAPTSYSALSGVRNRLTFTTNDNGSAWEVEYTSYGSVETTFVQPILGANGTMGGTAFAVDVVSLYYGVSSAYSAVDGNNGTYMHTPNNSTPLDYRLYNPTPLKVSQIDIIPISNYNPTNYTIYASNDYSTWTILTSGTNAITSSNFSIAIPEANRSFYKYYRLYSTATAGSYNGFSEIKLIATYLGT